MGRIGETIRRTWQLADAMKAGARPSRRWMAGALPSGRRQRAGAPLPGQDHRRAREDHGIEGEVGCLAPGHLADLVLWEPASFGAKPAAVMKGGAIAWGPIGEGNASVHGAEPTRFGPDWGGTGTRGGSRDHLRVGGGGRSRFRAHARDAPSRGRRPRHAGMRRGDLVANTAVPPIEVSRTDGAVTLGGRALAADPSRRVPLNRLYFL